MNSLLYWIVLLVFLVGQVAIQIIFAKSDLRLFFGFIIPCLLVLLSIIFAVKCFFYTSAESTLKNAIYMIALILLGIIDTVLYTVLHLFKSKTTHEN